MSLLKAVKGWREIVRLAIFRKGPKQLFLKPTVPKSIKHEYEGPWNIRDNHRITNTFLRSVLSRTSKLLSRYRLTSLQPRYAGKQKLRNIPILSLIGLSLSLDMDFESKHTDADMESTMKYVRDIFKEFKWEPECLDNNPQSLDDLEINKISVLGNGCEGAVFEAKLKNGTTVAEVKQGNMAEDGYRLAVKAVFNFWAESNANCIVRKMNKEIVPLQSSTSEPSQMDDIVDLNVSRLPSHPNVVDMHCVFVDDMLVTEQVQKDFPAVMPSRVSPDGFGRNKTLYLVMRKCTTGLSEFLTPDVSMTTRYLLLIQLLEAVHHMTSHGVAHRDIKADNILIDVSSSGGSPRLQICDFGFCLAEKNKKLEIPFVSSDVNLGGNSCLMAPEIACARPGEGSVLDFRRSDLWVCGAMAYQIFGAPNPFYPSQDKSSPELRSQTYNEDELPPLPGNVTAPIQRLVKSLLSRDPAKRPTASVAVLVLQMVFWESRRKGKRQIPRVVVTKGNRNCSSNYHGNKQRQKMGLVLAVILDVIRKMSTACDANQDMVDVSNFLSLSRLTYSDFTNALRFFH